VDDATLVGLRVGIGFEIVIDVYTHGTFSIMKCQISQKMVIYFGDKVGGSLTLSSRRA
jgi:hypothetical protein